LAKKMPAVEGGQIGHDRRKERGLARSWGKCADQILHMHNVSEMTARLSLHLLSNILQYWDETIDVSLG